MTEKYNGWTNYETWLWKIWIDNDQGSQEYHHELAIDYLENTESRYEWQSDRAAAVYELAECLQSQAEDQAGEDFNFVGPFSDLLNAALGRIEWREIAESLIGEAEEDTEEDNPYKWGNRA